MSIFLSHKDVWMCECVNETSYLIACLIQFRGRAEGATVKEHPAKVRGGESFFEKKMQQKFAKG